MANPHHLSARPAKTPLTPKGRGAQSNQSSRYDQEKRVFGDDFVDDKGALDNGDEFPSDNCLKTSITLETPRRIINWIDSPYVPFDRSINPYRGCEHGCTYCFARPSHAYYGLSPGLDFETKLFAKPNAAALLRKELSHKNYHVRPIAIGTNTDPYQPIEKRLRLMRQILITLAEFHHPVSILTKSSLITRDIDIIEPMGRHRLAKAMISITSLDPALARVMEPRASAPHKRFDAVRKLADAGAHIGVMTAPLIPGLNDDELETLLEKAKEAGAQFAGYTIVRLPQEVTDIFREWLEATFPHRAKRVMRHIQEMNDGKNYDPQWARSPKPRSVYAKLISDRFHKTINKLGLNENIPRLDCSLFKLPQTPHNQLSLFNESH